MQHAESERQCGPTPSETTRSSKTTWSYPIRLSKLQVGGEEAAAELVEGKAEWRESAWAWAEYVSMINTASITDKNLTKYGHFATVDMTRSSLEPFSSHVMKRSIFFGFPFMWVLASRVVEHVA